MTPAAGPSRRATASTPAARSAISEAGESARSLFLARLALLLFEQVGDEARCRAALADALRRRCPYRRCPRRAPTY